MSDTEGERKKTPREKDMEHIDSLLALIDNAIGPPPEAEEAA